MELIPILSTIILVATISTFILAIGAYILFKVQEKRADQFLKRGQEIEKAELLEPATVGDNNLAAEQPIESKVLERKQPLTVPNEIKSSTNEVDQKSKEHVAKKKPTGLRYMKYDSLGYKSIDDDNKRIITWR